MSQAVDLAAARADLRLKTGRSSAAMLLDRAEHLPEDEAALVRAVLGTGLSVAAVARLGGHDVATLRRRVQRILKRMRSPLFAYAIREGRHWSAARMSIVRECVFAGRSVRAAARATGQSVYAVRRHMMAIKAQCEVSRRPPANAGLWRDAEVRA